MVYLPLFFCRRSILSILIVHLVQWSRTLVGDVGVFLVGVVILYVYVCRKYIFKYIGGRETNDGENGTVVFVVNLFLPSDNLSMSISFCIQLNLFVQYRLKHISLLHFIYQSLYKRKSTYIVGGLVRFYFESWYCRW